MGWLRSWRRRRLLAQNFPDAWLATLNQDVRFYRTLGPDAQAALRRMVQVFIAEKHWEGCAGLVVTDVMRVVVAAQACSLLLGLEHDYFQHVLSILIYPADFEIPASLRPSPGLVEEDVPADGQAWYRGPVILAWDVVQDEARNPGCGRSVVHHEFAHQLDMLDRELNGTPPLQGKAARARWAQVMSAHFTRLQRAVSAGEPTLIDPYGATNETEFFAVVTECFFTRPGALRREHPPLYELLQDYYRQDPAERLARWRAARRATEAPELPDQFE